MDESVTRARVPSRQTHAGGRMLQSRETSRDDNEEGSDPDRDSRVDDDQDSLEEAVTVANRPAQRHRRGRSKLQSRERPRPVGDEGGSDLSMLSASLAGGSIFMLENDSMLPPSQRVGLDVLLSVAEEETVAMSRHHLQQRYSRVTEEDDDSRANSDNRLGRGESNNSEDLGLPRRGASSSHTPAGGGGGGGDGHDRDREPAAPPQVHIDMSSTHKGDRGDPGAMSSYTSHRPAPLQSHASSSERVDDRRERLRPSSSLGPSTTYPFLRPKEDELLTPTSLPPDDLPGNSTKEHDPHEGPSRRRAPLSMSSDEQQSWQSSNTSHNNNHNIQLRESRRTSMGRLLGAPPLTVVRALKEQYVTVFETMRDCATSELRTMTIRDLVSRISNAVLRINEGYHTANTPLHSVQDGTGSGMHVPNVLPYKRTNSMAMAAGLGVAVKTDGPRINSRDIRRLIAGFGNEQDKETSILVRRNVLLLNFDVLRCIILWDRLIVMVPQGGDHDSLRLKLERKLEENEQQWKLFRHVDGDEPPPVVEFEFLAMEAVLSTVISDYRDKAVALLDEVHRHLKRINSSTALKTSHQDHIRHCRLKVISLEARVRSLHKALFSVLDEEEDLALIYLTRAVLVESVMNNNGSALGSMGPLEGEALLMMEQAAAHDHGEAEALLESCLQDVNDVLAQLDLATQRLEATDDYLAMQARISQNKLLTIGAIVGVLQLSLSFGAVITGVFGMNLLNGISDTSGSGPSFVGFMLVVLVVLLIFLGLGAGGTLYLYRNKTLVL